MLGADERLFRWLNSLVGRADWFDNSVRLLASDFVMPVMLTVLAFGLWFYGKTSEERRRNQYAYLYGLIGVGFSNLFVRFINHFLHRPRPFLELSDVNVLLYQPSDPSFPSNAAAFAFSLAAGIWLANHKAGYAIAVGAVLFTLSRVIAGMHYPLDMVGGALLGILTAWLFAKLVQLTRPVFEWALGLLQRFYLA